MHILTESTFSEQPLKCNCLKNMKQKIVMKVQMNSETCRTKAMNIAATADGVQSVELQGPDKDQLVVIGDGIDSASLAVSLTQKVGYTTLVRVEEVKPPKTMKQKIVMKVQMNGEKCRTKAMNIAAVADGVAWVAIQGPDNDQVVVIGEGIDTASLVVTLRKEVGYTTLVSVEEVKPPKSSNSSHTP